MASYTVKCNHCGALFEKSAGDYNRAVKLKRDHYCSRSCSAAVSNKSTRRKNNNTAKLKSNNKLDDLSPFRYYINRVINGSGRKFGKADITAEYLKELHSRQNGLCAISSMEMILPKNCATKLDSPAYASLDRIDSSKGYLQGNVQFVCQFINLGKRDFDNDTVVEFIKLLKSV